tara:strand:+ start:4613 stop:4798 length:186 start_codon:yes stop_codon:yes gene_type:complete
MSIYSSTQSIGSKKVVWKNAEFLAKTLMTEVRVFGVLVSRKERVITLGELDLILGKPVDIL